MISRAMILRTSKFKRLGDVVEFLDSLRRPVTEADRRAGQFPYYGANGQQGTIDDYIFDEPLVLLAEDGGHFGAPNRGIAYRISGKTWVNNHAHVLRPREEMDASYLFRVLENYDVTPWVSGTTRGKLTQAGAADIVVPVPPLPEQNRIAEILEKADALRARCRAAISQLDTLPQSIFLDMFGDPATNPKGWRRQSLCELGAEFRYGTSNKSEANGRPTLRIPNIVGGAIDLADLKCVPVTDAKFERLKLRDGDLLFVRTNGNADFVGRCALFNDRVAGSSGFAAGDFIFASYIIRARVPADSVLPVFLREYCLGTEGRRQLRAHSKTSAGQYNINTEGLSQIVLTLPKMELQRLFVERVSAVERTAATQSIALAALDSLFVSLQHGAFNGEA